MLTGMTDDNCGLNIPILWTYQVPVYETWWRWILRMPSRYDTYAVYDMFG